MGVDQISKRDSLSLGSESDRYVVRSILGQGAFATVFLADDQQAAGRPVVLKLLSQDGGSDSDAGIERFRAEVAAMRRLEHPNIVRVLNDGVTSDNRPYLVTEWIGGRSLAAVLKESGPLTAGRAVDVGYGIAAALAYVHSRGLVHRDLKPSNVLIPGWPEAPDFKNAKLLDFGVAGRLEKGGRTQAGMIYGTLRYMSPEQIRGEQQSASTDVYGFGLLLFEMLAGSAPAKREQDLTTLLIAIRDGLSDDDLKAVEPDLADMIRRCVRSDPAQRPSMASVLEQLKLHRTKATLAVPVAFGTPPPAARPPVAESSTTPAAPAQASKFTERTVAVIARTVPRVPLPVQGAAGRRLTRGTFWLLFCVVAAVVAVGSIVYFRPVTVAPAINAPVIPNDTFINAVRFAAGLLLMGASIAIAFALRKWLGSRSDVKAQAYELVFGARARTDLTATIALQLQDLVSNLRKLDQRILAGTVALMLEEYGSATDTKDRQAALMNVVALSEKLALRLSPWYERHKEIIASAVAVMGGVSGLVTALNSVLAHKH